MSILTLAALQSLLNLGGLVRLVAVVVWHQVMGFSWYGYFARDAFIREMFGSEEEMKKRMEKKATKDEWEAQGKRGIRGAMAGAVLLAVLLSVLFVTLKISTIENALALGAVGSLIMLANSLIHAFWGGKSVNGLLIDEAFNHIVLFGDVALLHYIGANGL
jgi:hypothetical protein